MSIEFKLSAKLRSEKGSGNCYRLRMSKRIPGIVYGANKPQQMLSMDAKEVRMMQSHPEFYNHVIQLEIDGKAEPVILKSWQKRPTNSELMHLDFHRIQADKKMHFKVPIHFNGEDTAIGITEQKGILSHVLTEVMVECFPSDLPESLEVDISQLALGQSIHLSQIKLPKNVGWYRQHLEQKDPTVVSINSPQKEVVAEDLAAAEPEEDASKTADTPESE